MTKTEIPIAAVERNKAWIKAVTNSLQASGDPQLSRRVMGDAGKKCASQILQKVIEYHGRRPDSVEELVQAMNQRRTEVLKTDSVWELKGNQAHFQLEQCGCDLVEAGLADPNPTLCLCSAGMFENLFAPFWQGTVRTEIVKAIGQGDACCQFVVHLQE